MAYKGIDKKLFAWLLARGTDSVELQRFFSDNRTQLILKGVKLQSNPPRGKVARVRMLVQELPSTTDPILRKWCAENLTMFDPVPVEELVETLRMYEDAEESPPEDEAKRLARSCLVHLFKADPEPELISFLKPRETVSVQSEPELKEAMALPTNEANAEWLFASAEALVALAEGRDPDEHLASLPSVFATFVAGLHAIRNRQDNDVKVALEALGDQPEMRSSLEEYAKRSALARTRPVTASRGLQILQFVEPEDPPHFDFDRDEIIAICTKDSPETSVFVRPFAIRSASGAWISLLASERARLFPRSGDLISFSGQGHPKQPRRGEVGLWRVAENSGSRLGHQTNFHIASEKTVVYEVRDVPFASTEYDLVREYIKEQVAGGDSILSKTSLFLLRDDLIVGCPPGKDLTRNEGFEDGLPSWHTLQAFRFEGRTLVPGSLPPSEIYECEALGSSLKKLLAHQTDNRPARALVQNLQKILASGEVRLNADRAGRLRRELDAIDEHEGAIDVLLDEVMRNPKIEKRVNELVKERVENLVSKKEELRNSIGQLQREYEKLVEQQRQTEKEQRALAPSVKNAIRRAFEKARGDSVETLGQVVLFKALIDEVMEKPITAAVNGAAPFIQANTAGMPITVRAVSGGSASVIETLRSLGVTPKFAKAIEVLGRIAQECGLILIIDGLAARIAVELWLGDGARTGKILECGIGATDDSAVRDVLAEAPDAIAIVDANLSPIDIYARPLVDVVQRRLAGIEHAHVPTRILMSISSGVAALPLPLALESISLRVSLDCAPIFMQESDIAARLDEIEEASEHGSGDGWFGRLWKPAGKRTLDYLRSMEPDEAALALSVLDAAQVQTSSSEQEV
ncbi:MAG: tektin family protein [Betaproteobacteria bacterium]|nr:tektin family protein [Betaproteobacteria bacterium]